eukprot:2338905-Amphidinium_carterae.1
MPIALMPHNRRRGCILRASHLVQISTDTTTTFTSPTTSSRFHQLGLRIAFRCVTSSSHSSHTTTPTLHHSDRQYNTHLVMNSGHWGHSTGTCIIHSHQLHDQHRGSSVCHWASGSQELDPVSSLFWSTPSVGLPAVVPPHNLYLLHSPHVR